MPTDRDSGHENRNESHLIYVYDCDKDLRHFAATIVQNLNRLVHGTEQLRRFYSSTFNIVIHTNAKEKQEQETKYLVVICKPPYYLHQHPKSVALKDLIRTAW